MTTNTYRTRIIDRKIDLYRNTMYNLVALLEYRRAEGNASLRTWFPWEGWFSASCGHRPRWDFRCEDHQVALLNRQCSNALPTTSLHQGQVMNEGVDR
jgi:hypothetical protein